MWTSQIIRVRTFSSPPSNGKRHGYKQISPFQNGWSIVEKRASHWGIKCSNSKTFPPCNNVQPVCWPSQKETHRGHSSIPHVVLESLPASPTFMSSNLLPLSGRRKRNMDLIWNGKRFYERGNISKFEECKAEGQRGKGQRAYIFLFVLLSSSSRQRSQTWVATKRLVFSAFPSSARMKSWADP